MGTVPNVVLRRCAQCRDAIDILDHPTLKISIPNRTSRAEGDSAIIDLGAAPVLCELCRFRSLDTVAQGPFTDRFEWFTEARVRAGIPHPVTTWAVTGLTFQGHEAWSAGFQAGGLAVELTGEPPADWPMPWISGGQYTLCFAVLQLSRRESPAILEARWPYAQTAHAQINLEVLGWQSVPKIDHLKRLMDGVRFVREFATLIGGRPPGGDEDIQAAIRELLTRGELVSRGAVARQLFGESQNPRDSLKKRLTRINQRTGRTWEDIVGDAS